MSKFLKKKIETLGMKVVAAIKKRKYLMTGSGNTFNLQSLRKPLSGRNKETRCRTYSLLEKERELSLSSRKFGDVELP